MRFSLHNGTKWAGFQDVEHLFELFILESEVIRQILSAAVTTAWAMACGLEA
jgi:hypothetical protein